jgi:indolepyruvate ferredoxin oxidoreductase
VKFRDASLKANDRVKAIADVTGADNLSTVAANNLAESLLGNTIYANVLMLGYAWQKGLVPVSLRALHRAIELNAVEIENNRQAFNWGRIAAADPDVIERELDSPQADPPVLESLDDVVRRRAEFLTAYQNEALAEKYVALVTRVRDAEAALQGARASGLSEAVARSYFKTLAYKDEYEVARLHADSGFIEKIKRDFGDNAKLRFNLAPPFLPSGIDARGRPRKREFGTWMLPVFALLAKFRSIRGTRFDVFGMTAERKMERELINELEGNIDVILQSLSADNVDVALDIVQEYMEIRGYGPVKEQAAAASRAKIRSKLEILLNVTRKAA